MERAVDPAWLEALPPLPIILPLFVIEHGTLIKRPAVVLSDQRYTLEATVASNGELPSHPADVARVDMLAFCVFEDMLKAKTLALP
jgi:hypothetical protein